MTIAKPQSLFTTALVAMAMLLQFASLARAQEAPIENSDGLRVHPPAPVISSPTAANTPLGNDGPTPNVSTPPGSPAPNPLSLTQLPDLTKRENFSAAMQIILLLTVLSLAPAILLMMTSFTRIIIVLSLLRQALGTQQLPPNQVLIGLAMFMTFLVMAPTWQRVSQKSVQPYLNGSIDQKQALDAAQGPLRDFMIRQIYVARNETNVDLFAKFAGEQKPQTWKDVSTMTLIPAFMLSELKSAFILGFYVYLPFLIIDLVVSTILISMGMMMLPPAMISLPFKLLLFVLVDGWKLVTINLMGSFAR